MLVARLSTTYQLPHQLRLNAAVTEPRGITSCWTPRPIDQLYGRVPQPPTNSGSKFRVNTGRPRFWLSNGAHSPFAARFMRSQSGTKSLSASVHPRVEFTT